MDTFYQLPYHPIGIIKERDDSYVLTLRDLPLSEKPREKLLKHGPTILTSVELLAILMGTGTKKEEVLTMCARIMKEYGQKSLLSEMDAKRLSSELQIPIVKATQIVACGELARRFFQKTGHTSAIIRTPKQVFEYVKDMRDLSKEYLRGLYLNANYKVIHDEVISIGTLDTSVIHPREVFKPALEYSAVGVILVHNHPSGVPRPSTADITITMQLVKAGKLLGIELIDHVIVTKQSFLNLVQKEESSFSPEN